MPIGVAGHVLQLLRHLGAQALQLKRGASRPFARAQQVLADAGQALGRVLVSGHGLRLGDGKLGLPVINPLPGRLVHDAANAVDFIHQAVADGLPRITDSVCGLLGLRCRAAAVAHGAGVAGDRRRGALDAATDARHGLSNPFQRLSECRVVENGGSGLGNGGRLGNHLINGGLRHRRTDAAARDRGLDHGVDDALQHDVGDLLREVPGHGAVNAVGHRLRHVSAQVGAVVGAQQALRDGVRQGLAGLEQLGRDGGEGRADGQQAGVHLAAFFGGQVKALDQIAKLRAGVGDRLHTHPRHLLLQLPQRRGVLLGAGVEVLEVAGAAGLQLVQAARRVGKLARHVTALEAGLVQREAKRVEHGVDAAQAGRQARQGIDRLLAVAREFAGGVCARGAVLRHLSHVPAVARAAGGAHHSARDLLDGLRPCADQLLRQLVAAGLDGLGNRGLHFLVAERLAVLVQPHAQLPVVAHGGRAQRGRKAVDLVGGQAQRLGKALDRILAGSELLLDRAVECAHALVFGEPVRPTEQRATAAHQVHVVHAAGLAQRADQAAALALKAAEQAQGVGDEEAAGDPRCGVCKAAHEAAARSGSVGPIRCQQTINPGSSCIGKNGASRVCGAHPAACPAADGAPVSSDR